MQVVDVSKETSEQVVVLISSSAVLCQNPVRIENIDISVTSKQASES
jgi:hypothetical protein